MKANAPIGAYDSGVGGLSVVAEIRRLLPKEDIIYFADTAHLPYGKRPPEELRELAQEAARFLLAQEAKLIVVACNTATVHCIGHLRETFPQLPFVGVVPVVKTLARLTRTGTIAVLSTPATSRSDYLRGLISEFAPDKEVINVGCEGLENAIEAGQVRNRSTTALLAQHLAPVQGSRADVVGLGCTHYPFLRHRIKRMLGRGVRVYDPSRPVARRVRQLLRERDGFASNPRPAFRFYTTGDARVFGPVAAKLLRQPVRDVKRVSI